MRFSPVVSASAFEGGSRDLPQQAHTRSLAYTPAALKNAFK